MKTLVIAIVLCLISLPSIADENLIGIWKDKSEPQKYIYEFKEENEFIYSTKRSDGSVSTLKGIWEIGSWEITCLRKVKIKCNLTIYAGTAQCCFKYKFIANNLILTNKYKSDYGDIPNEDEWIEYSKRR